MKTADFWAIPFEETRVYPASEFKEWALAANQYPVVLEKGESSVFVNKRQFGERIPAPHGSRLIGRAFGRDFYAIKDQDCAKSPVSV